MENEVKTLDIKSFVEDIAQRREKALVDRGGKSLDTATTMVKDEIARYEEKAVPLNSGATNGGAEFIPTAQGINALIDVAQNKNTFLAGLSEGFQGSDL